MSIGLLDDIAAIEKVAAASLDDLAAPATKSGAKAAAVVIDDATVTPRYVFGFRPSRNCSQDCGRLAPEQVFCSASYYLGRQLFSSLNAHSASHVGPYLCLLRRNGKDSRRPSRPTISGAAATGAAIQPASCRRSARNGRSVSAGESAQLSVTCTKPALAGHALADCSPIRLGG
jgi:hypothetical protein